MIVNGSDANQPIIGNTVAAMTVILSCAIGIPGLGMMAFLITVTSTVAVVVPLTFVAVSV